MKSYCLTGRTAESGGVSIGLLFDEFVEEDCCQAGQLVEFDVAVSFGMVPRVLFRTKFVKILEFDWLVNLQQKNKIIDMFSSYYWFTQRTMKSVKAREIATYNQFYAFHTCVGITIRCILCCCPYNYKLWIIVYLSDWVNHLIISTNRNCFLSKILSLNQTYFYSDSVIIIWYQLVHHKYPNEYTLRLTVSLMSLMSNEFEERRYLFTI